MTDAATDTSEVTTIAYGIVFLSLCVPADWTKEQIEEAANVLHPTGIQSSWAISDESHFASGQTNPCECERGPSFKHHLLNC